MKYKIVFASNTRARIRFSFRITPDVKKYIESLFLKENNIKKVHFYADERHIALYLESYDRQLIHELLGEIQLDTLRTCYLEPKHSAEESPYSIISNAIYKKLVMQLFLPTPIKKITTIYQAIPYAIEAYKSIKHLQLDMSVLDFFAIFTSIVLGDFSTSTTIIFLLNIGNKLDNWSKKKSIKELESTINNINGNVWIETNEGRVEIAISKVTKGDVLVYSEGEEIIFDGEIIKGQGMINESSLTGESYPISKTVNDTVVANTLLQSGELCVKVTNETPNSGITALVKLIKQSEIELSSKQKKLLTSADKLVKFNFLGMFLTYVFTRSFSKTLSFLMVDFSCSLKLSTPIAYLTAIKEALDHQVVIKSASALDAYDQVDTFIFDKTGTITTSHPELRKVFTFGNFTETEVLRIGACLEEHIYHPIANAIVNKAKKEGIVHKEMHGELYHIASKGIRSSIDGVRVLIGSKNFMFDEDVIFSKKQLEMMNHLETEAQLLYLSYGNELIALFAIETPIRPEAAETLHFLKAHKKKVVLLTGDTRQRTEAMIGDLYFDEVLTEMHPEDKFTYVKNEKLNGRSVLMIGDGLNDSAAIAQADVGVAMGEAADISRQISDIILLSNDLRSLTYTYQLLERLNHKINTNLKTTIAINSSLIGLGLIEVLSPKNLALFHNLTTFFIIGNSFNLSKSLTREPNKISKLMF